MLPAFGSVAPSVDSTWMPLIVSVSALSAPLTVIVTVIVPLATEMEEAEMLRPFCCETLPTPALNRQPAGALKIIVPLVTLVKSELALSARTIFPKVVNVGVVTVAFCARSAERFDPPVAAVMETAWVLAAVQSPSRVRKEGRVNNFLIINDIRLEEQLHCRLAVGVGRPLVNRLARAGIA